MFDINKIFNRVYHSEMRRWSSLMNIGLMYYSRTGNTKKAAETLNEKLQSHTEHVETIELLHEKKLGFFGAARLAMKGEHPPIMNNEVDVNKFDRLIIGTPVWAGRPAPYVYTFLDHNSLSKEIKTGVFLTSGGSSEKQQKTQEIFKENLMNYKLKPMAASLIFQMKKGIIKDGTQNIDTFINELLSEK